MHSLARAVLVVALVIGLIVPAFAHDVVLTRKKERLEGAVISETDKEIKFYPYFAAAFPNIEWEVLTLPRNEVVKIEKVEDKLQTFWGRAWRLAADDVKGWLELAKYAVDNKLDAEKVQCAAAILAHDPQHAEALALAGDKAKALFKDDLRLNPTLAERIRAYCAILPKSDRKAEYEAMKKDVGVTLAHTYYERIARATPQPKGRRDEVKLTLQSDKITGLYAIYVPESYDPARPIPLVIGLHGGGPDGADGKGVVGSGKDFMNFIEQPCNAHGFIAVCPNARAAPWSAPENDAFFLAVIREVEMLYHIDLNRVYLVGHSMGGYGTWHFGPKYSEQFAVIAPASGGGNNGQKQLATNHTACYVYHSNDDPRCRVDDSRTAAKVMKKTAGMDFIYTELPNRQHDFPQEVIVDIFEFFERHRQWLPVGAKNARPTREPRSSFLGPLTPEEAQTFPFPDAAAGEPGKGEIAALVQQIIKGGGNAEKAAQKLGELKDATAVPMLGKVLTAAELAGEDGRAQAAVALGVIGNSAGVKFLQAALKDKSQAVRTRAVEALGLLAEPKSLPAVQQAVKDLAARFGTKVQGKNTMDLTDWDALMAEVCIYARAVGNFKDPKTVADLQDTLVRKMIFATVDVRFDQEVQPGPKPTQRTAAAAVIDALETIGTPAVAPLLEEIAKGVADDTTLSERAREIARKVNG